MRTLPASRRASGGESEPPAALTFGSFLDEVAARYGEREAVVFGERRLSYDELREQSRRLARGMVAIGIGKGSRVAIQMGNRPEWIIAAFGAGMIGAVAVPVSTFAPAEERDHVLRHCDAQLLVMQDRLLKHRYLESLLESHPGLAGEQGRLRVEELPALRRVVCLAEQRASGVDPWDRLLAGADEVPEALLDGLIAEVAPADDGIIIYTSGTTSKPKGVLHSQRTPMLQAWRVGEQLRIGPGERILSSYPYFWTAGIALGLGATLATGGCIVGIEAFDPARVLELIEAERVTAGYFAPHQEVALAEHPDAGRRDLSSLVHLQVDSPLRPLAGIEDDSWGMPGAYGLSETFTFATSSPADAPVHIRRGRHGRPLPGTLVRIVDPEAGTELPQGEIGEIVVKGTTLMRGYYKVEPERCFDEDGFFHTGDAGFIDEEGYLRWIGRRDGLIKTGGANVSPVEIEEELMRWGRLGAFAVVGVPHPTLGEAVVLCATRRAGLEVEGEAVTAYLSSRLAAYKVPREVLFVAADALELTSSQQKVAAQSLRRLAASLLAEQVEDEAWRAQLRELGESERLSGTP